MTENRLPLNEFLQKAGDGDFLRAVAESPAIADGGGRRGADWRWSRRRDLARGLPHGWAGRAITCLSKASRQHRMFWSRRA